MKNQIALLLFSCLALLWGSICFSQTTASYEREDSGVSELSEKDLGIATRDGRWFIMVHAPWCSHCQQLKPVWANLAKELQGSRVRLGMLDGTRNARASRKLHVESFPSLFVLDNGLAYKYEGARSLEALKTFALTGWEAAPSQPIPKAAGFLERFVQTFGGNLETTFGLFQFLLTLSLICGFLGGILYAVFKLRELPPDGLLSHKSRNNNKDKDKDKARRRGRKVTSSPEAGDPQAKLADSKVKQKKH